MASENSILKAISIITNTIQGVGALFLIWFQVSSLRKIRLERERSLKELSKESSRIVAPTERDVARYGKGIVFIGCFVAGASIVGGAVGEATDRRLVQLSAEARDARMSADRALREKESLSLAPVRGTLARTEERLEACSGSLADLRKTLAQDLEEERTKRAGLKRSLSLRDAEARRLQQVVDTQNKEWADEKAMRTTVERSLAEQRKENRKLAAQLEENRELVAQLKSSFERATSVSPEPSQARVRTQTSFQVADDDRNYIHRGELRAELTDAPPPWVRKGCGAFFGQGKNVICGVGEISRVSNLGRARSAAEERGRTQITRSLRDRCRSMLRNYRASVETPDSNMLDNEKYVEDTSNQIASVAIGAARLEDTWVSPEGTFYALMVMDLDAFRAQVNNMNLLDGRVRRAITDRAESSFSDLDSMTEGVLPSLEP